MSRTDTSLSALPAGTSPPLISLKPVVIAAAERGEDLRVRVSAAAQGEGLPVVLFSHGFGWSMDAYAPLVDYWAAHGFVVIQPTHLDSRRLGLAPIDSRYPTISRVRVDDFVRVLDSLGQILKSVPDLAGRVDRDRVAVAGHSWGAQTASMLLGARVLNGDANEAGDDMSDPRVRAGVLLSIPGTGESLTSFAAENFPFMRPCFETLSAPSLAVAGERDDSPLSSRGPDWFTDAYRLSPGVQHLVTLLGGQHSLGGIVGERVAETTDESPDRVALVQQLTAAILRTVLGTNETGWRLAVDAARAHDAGPVGRLDSK